MSELLAKGIAPSPLLWDAFDKVYPYILSYSHSGTYITCPLSNSYAIPIFFPLVPSVLF